MGTRLALALAALLALAGSAPAVSFDWVRVGNPSATCDEQPQGCFGDVRYSYQISQYEVTNAQYAEFLNAKASSDPFALYAPTMDSSPIGGITRSGSSGSFTYEAKPGREDMPVNFISFYDAVRFVNWMHNGQGSGDTETGSYTLQGGTAIPSNGELVQRNPGATIVIPREDEWYKAAYHDALGTPSDFFDYPAGSDTETTCTAPTAAPNSANCDAAGDDASDPDVDDFTVVGSFTGSPSPYGTFDQGGNAWEWTEAIIGSVRVIRGGAFMNFDGAEALAASHRRAESQTGSGFLSMGFRVAMIPEPGTGLLLLMGLAGLAGHRRRR